MDMVWHQHIAPHRPLIRFFPRTNHRIVRHRIGKDRLPILGTNRDKNKDRAIRPLNHRLMHRMPPP